METALQFIRDNLAAAVEILLLTVAIYYGYLSIRETRGAKVLGGIAFIFITLVLVSQLLNLSVISWLLRSAGVFLLIALVVVFQPELRRLLADLGSQHMFAAGPRKSDVLDVIIEVVIEMANKQMGALIAIERETGIRVFAESGVNIDCDFSPELVQTIFFPKTPLHDGGLIVRNDRIVAAACIFPVSQRELMDRSLGLQHRAGLGISEESDAIAIVVSEETGVISICHMGKLERMTNNAQFRTRLRELMLQENDERTAAEQLEG